MAFPGSFRPSFSWLFLVLGAASCAEEVLPERAGAALDEPPRHVVMVVIDTLRADALGCYRSERGESPTPSIDALAARGTRFSDVESSSSWTVSSAIAYMSGLDPLRHGVNSKLSRKIPDDVPLLAEALSQGGFRTAAFISNPLLTAKLGFDRGFDSFSCSHFQAAGPTVDEAVAWLRSQTDEVTQGERLFLYVHLFDPHWPYEPASPEAERFQLPPSPLNEDEQVRASIGLMLGDPAATRRLMEWVPWARRAYSACVTTADRETGRLLNELDVLGLSKSTLAIVTSDHGEEFGEHGTIGHAKQLFAESLAVPLVFAGPGVERGVVAAEPAELRHLAATVLTRTGLFGESAIRGADLLDVDSRAEASSEAFIASVQVGIMPTEGGRFRRVQQQLSVRQDGQRTILGFDQDPAAARGWSFPLGQDGVAQPIPVSSLAPSAPAARLLERWAERRTMAEVAGSDLAQRREELRALGYFDSTDEKE